MSWHRQIASSWLRLPHLRPRTRLAELHVAASLLVVSAYIDVEPSRSLLLESDDPVLLRTPSETLRRDGHAVTAAPGGQAGIDAMRQVHASRRSMLAGCSVGG